MEKPICSRLLNCVQGEKGEWSEVGPLRKERASQVHLPGPATRKNIKSTQINKQQKVPVFLCFPFSMPQITYFYDYRKIKFFSKSQQARRIQTSKGYCGDCAMDVTGILRGLRVITFINHKSHS